MNSAYLSRLWNLVGVTAIKPKTHGCSFQPWRLQAKSRKLDAVSAPRHHCQPHSCLLFFQTTLSNKIQRQDHLFFPHPFQIFLWNCLILENLDFNTIILLGSHTGTIPQLELTQRYQNPGQFCLGRGRTKGSRWCSAWDTWWTLHNPPSPAPWNKGSGANGWRSNLSALGEAWRVAF